MYADFEDGEGLENKEMRTSYVDGPYPMQGTYAISNDLHEEVTFDPFLRSGAQVARGRVGEGAAEGAGGGGGAGGARRAAAAAAGGGGARGGAGARALGEGPRAVAQGKQGGGGRGRGQAQGEEGRHWHCLCARLDRLPY